MESENANACLSEEEASLGGVCVKSQTFFFFFLSCILGSQRVLFLELRFLFTVQLIGS